MWRLLAKLIMTEATRAYLSQVQGEGRSSGPGRARSDLESQLYRFQFSQRLILAALGKFLG